MATYSKPPILNRGNSRNQQVWVYVVTNQLVTPGLGSLMAGRRVAGAIQLSLAVTGFLLVMCWFVLLYSSLFELMDRWNPKWSVDWTLLLVGLGVFGTAWLLALHTSWGLLRQAHENAKQT